MEEKNEIQTPQVKEVIVEKDDKGKLTGYVAIVIAVIALVLSLANLGIRNEIHKVKQQIITTKSNLLQKEQLLEDNLIKAQIMSALDRVYALSMVEKNYKKAKEEFINARNLYEKIKAKLPTETASKMDSYFNQLESELNKGPSPIPQIIWNMRNLLSVTVKSPAPKAPAMPSVKEKTQEIPSPQIEKGEKVKEKKGETTEEKAPATKKFYEFWKSIGEKLAK